MASRIIPELIRVLARSTDGSLKRAVYKTTCTGCKRICYYVEENGFVFDPAEKNTIENLKRVWYAGEILTWIIVLPQGDFCKDCYLADVHLQKHWKHGEFWRLG